MKKRFLLLFISSWIVLMGCSAKAMGQNDSTGQTLPPCGTKPNCVSSQSTSERHRTEPFRLDGSGPAAIKKLQTIISALPGTTIIEADDLFLHAEFKSRLFGFVDDVAFLANEKEGRVEVRSASRTGYYDFGVNRRRVEQLRRLYKEK